jgi:hypothetical protein
LVLPPSGDTRSNATFGAESAVVRKENAMP